MKKNSELITQSFFPALLNLEGEIPLKRGRFVTPIFCNDKILPSKKCIRLHFENHMFHFLKILEKPRRI
jgi:hypothetical protein